MPLFHTNALTAVLLLLTFIGACFAQCSGKLLLALIVVAVRAGALLSPDLHVEHSPLKDADVRVVQLIEDALCFLLKELKIRDWQRAGVK